MDNTKIEWCDSTWNPVTGCLHGCEYCYARNIAHRFDGMKKLKYGARAVLDEPVIIDGKKSAYPYGFVSTFHKYRLNDYIGKQGRNIFVCSMADLFGKWVPDSWIEEIFAACEKAPQHQYLFLTKNPQRYADLDWADKLPVRDNMWYGTSVTNAEQAEWAADSFGQLPTRAKTFFSIEPILEDITATNGWQAAENGSYAKWVIVGAETGCRKEKVVPEQDWIKKIVTDCDEGGIPVFMKDSLIPIIGEENMRREFPQNLRRQA